RFSRKERDVAVGDLQFLGPYAGLLERGGANKLSRPGPLDLRAQLVNANAPRTDTPKPIGGIWHQRSAFRRTICPRVQGVLGTETFSSASHHTRAGLIQTKIVSHIHEHAAIPWPAASRQWLARRSYPGCCR